MELSSIKTLISSKDNWNSRDLIKEINRLENGGPVITLCHIGSDELAKDGTIKETFLNIEEFQDFLYEYMYEFDESITDFTNLAKSFEKQWKIIWYNRGGSAWIEYN